MYMFRGLKVYNLCMFLCMYVSRNIIFYACAYIIVTHVYKYIQSAVSALDWGSHPNCDE